MIQPQQGDHASKPNRTGDHSTSRLLWLLGFVGFAVTVTTQVMYSSALSSIEQNRENAEFQRETLYELESAINHNLVAAREEVDTRLHSREAAPVADWHLRIANAAESARRAIHNLETALVELTELQSGFEALDLLRHHVMDWSATSVRNDEDLTATVNQFHQSLNQLQGDVAKAVGQQRLSRTIGIMQCFDLMDATNSAAAREILNHIQHEPDLSTLDAELSEVESLVSNLLNETNRDQLTNIKDNGLLASILRLRRQIANAENRTDLLPQGLLDQLHGLEEILFGKDFQIHMGHQTIIPGEKGLFGLCQARFILADQKAQLRQQVADQISEIERNKDELMRSANEITATVALEAENAVRNSGLTALIVGLFAGLIFLVLAVRIGYLIHRNMKLIEDNSRELHASEERLGLVVRTSMDAMIAIDEHGLVTLFNPAAEALLGVSAMEMFGQTLDRFVPEEHLGTYRQFIEDCFTTVTEGGFTGQVLEAPALNAEGQPLRVELSVSVAIWRDQQFALAIIRNVEDRQRLQAELAQAQKMESIGQLAAGIAHEINTPTQYVGDNTRFLRDSVEDLLKIIERYAKLLDPQSGPKSWDERSTAIQAAIEELDVNFLKEEIPKAIAQSLEGVERVTTIVRSMKEFSHPGGDGKQLSDLNRAIESTITVSSNEWKYVADLKTDLDPDLPMVPCQIGDFNQVVLIMIVNASHAIKDVVGESGEKGTITISSRRNGSWAEIRIHDTGSGIPENVRKKIFDPFFTTKEVGKGTGQGLAIANTVIIKKHQGEIKVESTVGEGTTFIIRLPIDAREEKPTQVDVIDAEPALTAT